MCTPIAKQSQELAQQTCAPPNTQMGCLMHHASLPRASEWHRPNEHRVQSGLFPDDRTTLSTCQGRARGPEALNIISARCWRLCEADGRCTTVAVALLVCHDELTPLVHYVCTHTRTVTSDIDLRTVRKGIALMLARAGDFNTLKAEMRPPGRIWTICQA